MKTPEEWGKAIADSDDWMWEDYAWDGEDERLIRSIDRDKLAQLIAAAVRQALLDCAGLVEARRRRVLADPTDPSRTEHFAELESEIRAAAGEGPG